MKPSRSTITKLNKIIKHIEEDPRRFDMGDWASKRRGPACGTTGCIAGWAIMLKYTPEELKKMKQRDLVDLFFKGCREPGDGPVSRGAKALGIDVRQGSVLFLHNCWPVKFFAAYENAKTRKEKVAVAVERIRYFIRTGG